MPYEFKRDGNIPPSEEYFNHSSLAIAWPRVVARAWGIINDVDQMADFISKIILDSNEKTISKERFTELFNKYLGQEECEDSLWMQKLFSLTNNEDVLMAFTEEGLTNCKPEIGDANFFQRFYNCLKHSIDVEGFEPYTKEELLQGIQQAWLESLTPLSDEDMWIYFKRKFFINFDELNRKQKKKIEADIDDAIFKGKSYFVTSEVRVRKIGEEFDYLISPCEEKCELIEDEEAKQKCIYRNKSNYNPEAGPGKNGWEHVGGIDHTVIYTLPSPPEGDGDLGLALADYSSAGKTYVFTST